ncbi:MAG: DUF4870 domain-containing protein [Armatimonadota bacterium]
MSAEAISERGTEERTWAALCHGGHGLDPDAMVRAIEAVPAVKAILFLESILSIFMLPVDFAVTLVVWIRMRRTFPLVDDQGKEALNFHMSVTIYILATIMLVGAIAYLASVLSGWRSIPIMMLIAVCIPSLLIGMLLAFNQTILAARHVQREGTPYRYPWTMRFLK